MDKNRSLTALTALVLTACFVMTASLFLALKNFNSFLVSWGKDLQMTVYLKDEVQDLEVQKLMSLIKENSSVEDVRQVSSEENFEHFKRQMGSMFPQVQSSQDFKALVPTTLQIIFDMKNSLEEPIKVFAGMAEKIKSHDTVEQVSYGQIWVEKFSRFFFLIRQIFLFVALVMVLASIFVFSNAVRAWVHSKRSEIEVLELVGATSWTIRKPYVMKGLVLGLSTGCLGLVTVVLLTNYLGKFIASQDMLSGLARSLHGFTAGEAMGFILFSTSLGILASYLCVREINNGWAAKEGN